jgi:hypothetical protein
MRRQEKRVSSLATRVILALAVCVPLGPAAAGAQSLCQPRTDAAGRECFVSLTGNDNNPGTITQPFRTIAQGVRVVQQGDILSLREGVYVEPVAIASKKGTAAKPIVIQSYPGEQAVIDGSVPEPADPRDSFRTLNNRAWQRATLFDASALPDEYVSAQVFMSSVRGAFLDSLPYTRLITYARIEDLRQENETFDQITDYPQPDPRPGPVVMEECQTDDVNPACVFYQDADGVPTRYKPAQVRVRCEATDPDPDCIRASDGNRYKSMGYRRPWVYMGPGIWYNRDPQSPTAGRVHIRLAHTTNNVPGLADYTGETDPRAVRLAMAPESMVTLRVQGSSYLRFERLAIRYGGEYTLYLTGGTGLVFDHVRIFASTYGVRTGTNIGTTFRHCEFDGGKPSWYFRTDGKAEYYFLEDGVMALNRLGKQTMRSLFLPSHTDTGTIIHHCEFHDAHDLYLGGSNVDFHHNWLYDLNDEGLFLDAYGKQNVRVHENVILKTLSPISFAGEQVGGTDKVGGPFYIYRNLVDMRAPTAGYRPRFVGDADVWRYGNTFKSNGEDGPYALFQNTFLVYAQRETAAYLHYRNLTGSHQRRSFNNIFVAVNPDTTSDKPITLLPSPAFPAETKGNAYHRIGQATKPRYLSLQYEYGGPPSCPLQSDPNNPQNPPRPLCDKDTFACLTGCSDPLYGSLLFEQSQRQYEVRSIEADPQFQQIRADGLFRMTDDLRLRGMSPARAAGVRLPDDLRALDAKVVPATDTPDIGCYPYGRGPLRVGVDGRRPYPASP